MTNWMLRGSVLAAAMVLVRVVQGALINVWQTQAGLISIVLLILFVIATAIWGVFDGRADALAHPDPDRRDDLAMTWLLAGLVAGLESGAVSWVISLFDKAFYAGGLINELTTFAAFTALVVFLAGIAGATSGRWNTDRNPRPVTAMPGGDDERADTDVFTAVRADDTPTEGFAAAQAEQQTSALAVAQHPEGSGAATTAWSEEPTQIIPAVDDAEAAAQTAEAPTEAVPTAEGAPEPEETDATEQTKPTPQADDDQG